jgi:hypothetical protein
MTETSAGPAKLPGDGRRADVPSGPDVTPGSAAVISPGTRLTAAIMALTLVLLVTTDYLSAPGGPLRSIHDFILAAQYLMPLAMAVLILQVARSIEKDSSVRKQWVLFGLALLSFGLGSLVLIGLYVFTGKDTYPSFAEVLTLGGYAIFGAAFYRSLRAYRGFLSLRKPVIVAAIVSVVTMVLIYFFVIAPYVIFYPGDTQSTAARVFNTLYVVLDVFVLFMPCVALGLLLSKLGTGRVAWPWWFVAGGAGSLVIPDTIFAYTGAVGIGRTPLIDLCYAMAPMLIGLAVLVARDVYSS